MEQIKQWVTVRSNQLIHFSLKDDTKLCRGGRAMQNDLLEDIVKDTEKEQEYFQDEAWPEVEHEYLEKTVILRHRTCREALETYSANKKSEDRTLRVCLRYSYSYVSFNIIDGKDEAIHEAENEVVFPIEEKIM